mmetsp:Transcript_1709/g.5344  ORF Transcript_1709/g.5344 Transcript_1709/m.5344 type:complete len:97 (-) Transcript_1709:126-416(-)
MSIPSALFAGQRSREQPPSCSCLVHHDCVLRYHKALQATRLRKASGASAEGKGTSFNTMGTGISARNGVSTEYRNISSAAECRRSVSPSVLRAKAR